MRKSFNKTVLVQLKINWNQKYFSPTILAVATIISPYSLFTFHVGLNQK